jgi:predicted nuclease of predicted toxin-antitoxin system
MKLLFDNNLSHKLVAKLSDIFPNSTHVMTIHLDESEDEKIWGYAKENGFIIVTKDADFNEISLLKGYPPKVIWIRIANCKIADIEKIIRNNNIVLNEFYHNQNSGIIEID